MIRNGKNMKDKFTQQEKTFGELITENYTLDERLKEAREEEKKAQLELRLALNKLDNIQKDIKLLDEQFEKNCSELQDLNK